MLEKLIQTDQNLFVLLNGSGIPALDPLMKLASSTWIWIPIYLVIAFLMIRKNRKQGFVGVLFLLLTLVFTEQISVQAFKEVFERLRPCHDPSMAGRIRLVLDECGGQFGFVSTHATNAAGLLIFSLLVIRNRIFTWSIIVWALIVSYSRIYLGVHYPGDILGGLILGLSIGYFSFRLFKYILKSPIFHEEKNS